ncbi:hypothetical protein NBH00_24535 [Paraconexibacter antarcticus]|uniref:Uncharacterized protein n=1 Tax=Paraconexibacter antarcticus TaxID=2949664 RepID=A0ABY5DR31_9ACTN|nr:hypothetical protein [Paraconexibacter antarcticus]UTI64491.1 hypothetical protein NBH00_24535 [Paraconexibacter antarcticus]
MAQRISIGFHASPPVALRVSDDELLKLQSAVGSEGWHQVDAEDGTVKINLQHVLWLKVDKDPQRVGFGLGA